MQGNSIDLFQAFLLGTLIILIFVVFIILFVVVYRRRQNQQEIRILEMEAQYQRELLQATIESQEQERERIARDLHDEIGAMLSTINLGVVRYQKKSEPGSREEKFSSQTKALVDSTTEQVRRISRDLLPATLGRFGLWVSISELFEVVKKQGGMEVHLAEIPVELAQGTQQRKEERRIKLSTEAELGLYRIVQEATNNTLKYASASRVELTFEAGKMWIEEEEGKFVPALIMTYRDNGKGFSVPEAKDRKSLGLKNMESRVSVLGGQLEIESAAEEGALIRVKLQRGA